MGAATFFTPEDRKRIEESIRAVERHTAGEVAVMIVDASDTYPEARLRAALVMGGLVALACADRLLADSLWVFLPLALVLGGIFYLLTGRLPFLTRLFASGARMETQVRRAAELAFYDQGLHRTRDRTGVLFFLSLLEHRVWILADAGIYRKIDQNILNGFANEVAAGMRRKRGSDALCRQIEAAGALLAAHFPARADDVNELPDTVILGED
ncbi:MAG: hypothetical protein AB1568_14120 [Thermodesulfobacteriota bacterium]